jgi:hypothetical protein
VVGLEPAPASETEQPARGANVPRGLAFHKGVHSRRGPPISKPPPPAAGVGFGGPELLPWVRALGLSEAGGREAAVVSEASAASTAPPTVGGRPSEQALVAELRRRCSELEGQLAAETRQRQAKAAESRRLRELQEEMEYDLTEWACKCGELETALARQTRLRRDSLHALHEANERADAGVRSTSQRLGAGEAAGAVGAAERAVARLQSFCDGA